MAIENRRLSIPEDAYGGIYNSLSAREKDVTICTANGYEMPDIAKILGLSTATVRAHRANIASRFVLDKNEFGGSEVYLGKKATLAYLIDGINHGKIPLETKTPPIFPLTESEFGYVDLLTHRRLLEEMAVMLGVSINTARAHMKHIREKLDVRNSYHMAAVAVDLHRNHGGIPVDKKTSDLQDKERAFEFLTSSEKRVFDFVVSGLSNAEIQERLSISNNTRRNVFAAIRNKARKAGLSEAEISQAFKPVRAESPRQINVTPREIQILELRREGKTYLEIGETLGISAKTVSVHLQKLRKKSR